MTFYFSVYEVYVKEETAGSEGRNDVTVVPSLPSANDHQLIQVIMNGELTINFPLLTVIINNVSHAYAHAIFYIINISYKGSV